MSKPSLTSDTGVASRGMALFEKAVMPYYLEDWCQRDSVQFSGMPGAQLADEISPVWPAGQLSIGVGQSGVCFCLDQRADKSATSADCSPSFPMSLDHACFFSFLPVLIWGFFTVRRCFWQLDVSSCTQIFAIQLSSRFKGGQYYKSLLG